jgi:hypothetical protein
VRQGRRYGRSCADVVRGGAKSEAIRMVPSDCIQASPDYSAGCYLAVVILSPTGLPAANELGDMGSQWPLAPQKLAYPQPTRALPNPSLMHFPDGLFPTGRAMICQFLIGNPLAAMSLAE